MLQAYGCFSGPEDINKLSFRDFNLYLLCMYNFIALQHGIDPEKPPVNSPEAQAAPKARKVGGVEAARLIMELAEKKSQGGNQKNG